MSKYPCTPDNIRVLVNNEIFVFGSNTAGRHGKGAALQAATQFGAVEGVAEGLSGRTYAIPTREYVGPRQLYDLSLKEIGRHVERFLTFARRHQEYRFLVTKIGCGHAGYSPKDIAPLFHACNIPINVTLPATFWSIRNQHTGPRGPFRVIVPEDEIGENSRGECT